MLPFLIGLVVFALLMQVFKQSPLFGLSILAIIFIVGGIL